MKVVVGLGNPGDKYAATRHNVGFWVIDKLSDALDIPCRKEKFQSLIGEGTIGREKIVLCKPQTYMNLSGEAVSAIVQYFRELDAQQDIVVVYDDMDFPPGELRLRQQGSAGGHNGIKSIIQHLGTQTFPRVRVGIGRPGEHDTVIQHVLSPFSKDTLPDVQRAVDAAADAVEFVVKNSFAAAMNRFNGAR